MLVPPRAVCGVLVTSVVSFAISPVTRSTISAGALVAFIVAFYTAKRGAPDSWFRMYA